ncbi:MAG: pilus assembly protein TadG-related protein [Candidatus Aquicultorales bacterium]
MAVIVAICLVVFLGFTAMVVDYGYLAYVQRKLQTAADAAALAGAQEIIYGGDPEVVARNYAFDNDVKDTDTLTIAVDDEEEEVRVTVSRDVGLFFGPVLGVSTNTRIARAKAKVVWITGLSNLVPFGVTDIRGDVWAGVDGNFVRLSDGDNDNVYEGGLTVAGSGSKSVTVQIRSLIDGSLLKEVEQATAVMLEPTPIKKSQVTPNFIKIADPETISTNISIEGTSTIASVAVTLDGTATYLTSAGIDANGNRRYSGFLASPTAVGTYPVNVEITVNPGDPPDIVGPIDYIRVVDSFSPVGEVDASISSIGTVSFSVQIEGFQRGDPYEMRWDADPAKGNFMSIRFDDEQGVPNYKDHILNGSSYDYSIGDIIRTEPGKMGNHTSNTLNERIGDDTCSWNPDTLKWEDASGNQHFDCPRLIVVPLVGGYSATGGSFEAPITGFATFFIDSVGDEGTLVGYFVEYPDVGSLWTPEDPGDPLRPRTVRLMPFD